MKTQVEIRIVVDSEDDDKYQEIMSNIESELRFNDNVESVDIGIGEAV